MWRDPEIENEPLEPSSADVSRSAPAELVVTMAPNVAYKSRLKLAARAVLSADAGLLVLSHHMVVWGIHSLLCVILFVFCFFCTVTDFSAMEKGRGVKFCPRVGLLSRQVSRFGGQRSRSPGQKRA